MESSYGTRFRAAMIVFSVFVATSAPAQIDFGDDSSKWSNDGECDDPRFEGDGMASLLLDEDRFADATDCRSLYQAGRIRVAGAASAPGSFGGNRSESGTLAPGDGTLRSGEYRDQYFFDGATGALAVIDLRSEDFDPYLIVRTPSGEQHENDDYEGDVRRAMVALTLPEDGRYEVLVTSYEPAETGEYRLEIRGEAVAATVPAMEERGNLRSGDRSLQSGELMDSYRFSGEPGQRIAVDLRSDDFDTYLILVSPSGAQEENDDADDDVGHSRIEAELTESGSYEIIVTSYEPGEAGSYTLTVGEGTANPSPRESAVTMLTAGIGTMGRLESGDVQIDSGEFQDLFGFSGEAGQRVSVELRSADFDTYLALITPDGDIFENDDFEGSTALSVVQMTLPETGRYRVAATSYQAGETGDYELLVSFDSNAAGGLLAAGNRPASGGQTFGIFAGISDYPGSENDLEFTAEDAVRVRDALIRGGNMPAGNAVTLTDGAATIANFRRAMEDVASRAGPDDTLVIFYSGHGNRVMRAAGPESADPDSLDETIELYDGAISDDDLRAMLEPVRAGTALLLLDSCFSGGFAKDVISVPGRMGLFSSEEDVTSQVAVKFRAGGYLAYFLDEAIGDRLADDNGDGQVTALELSEYVHYRYRNDVKSAGPGDYVRTGGRQSGYQHLVVDRGSIGPDDVLFP